jgi:Flp pilus assembly protein TadB
MIEMLPTLMVGGGIVLVAYGVARYRGARNVALEELLEIELDKATRTPMELSTLMERAGAFTDKALGRTPVAERIRTLQVQGGSTQSAGEFGGVLGLTTAIIAALAFLLSGSPVYAAAAVVLIPIIALSRLKKKARKRIIRLETQLPEVLQLIAGSLDSGTSLLTSMELAAEEGDEPLALELGRVVAEASVGRPLLEALDAMAARIGSNDISWTVKAIRIQNQTGGKLADTLRVLADFMYARVEVRGEVRALSAEARVSGKILIAMPILIGAFFYTMRRDYMQPVLDSTVGHIMLGGAVTGIILGHLWMKKMVRVEV